MWKYNYTQDSNEIYHHGIRGQKWGVRRFQNPDGSLTARGKRHQKRAINGLKTLKTQEDSLAATYKYYKDLNKQGREAASKHYGKNSAEVRRYDDAIKQLGRDYMKANRGSKLMEAYLEEYKSGRMIPGEDYTSKRFNKGRVELTDTGRDKEKEVYNRIAKQYKKEHAKEIKRYR